MRLVGNWCSRRRRVPKRARCWSATSTVLVAEVPAAHLAPGVAPRRSMRGDEEGREQGALGRIRTCGRWIRSRSRMAGQVVALLVGASVLVWRSRWLRAALTVRMAVRSGHGRGRPMDRLSVFCNAAAPAVRRERSWSSATTGRPTGAGPDLRTGSAGGEQPALDGRVRAPGDSATPAPGRARCCGGGRRLHSGARSSREAHS
jgi:hypothetical protein